MFKRAYETRNILCRIARTTISVLVDNKHSIQDILLPHLINGVHLLDHHLYHEIKDMAPPQLASCDKKAVVKSQRQRHSEDSEIK